ncbi:MAG TPA: PHP domain-containing protein, partial [Polyangiaceae bacterium]|nr:PHP domain-containing protein [Polyangiaceae bacterium]
MTWLHVKSHYSLGVGTASIPAIIAHASEAGIRALALTDLENLYGQVELHRGSRAAGVRAITGIELREQWAANKSHGTKRGRIVLLARDRTGYANLCRIVHARRSSAKPTPAPIRTLERLGDLAGLFILTDDPSTLAQAVRVAAVADVRALVVRPGGVHPEAALLAEAKRHGIRGVASCEGIFLDAAEWELHRLIGAVHLALGVREAGVTIETSDRRVRSRAAMQALFLDIPDA